MQQTCIIEKMESQSSFSQNIHVPYLKDYDKIAFQMSIIYLVQMVLELFDT